MSSGEWHLPPSVQPKQQDFGFDLEAALSAMVGVHAQIPADAFTAETLGTERAGNGVVIRADGLVLTIGYLLTEANEIWLHLSDGRIAAGHMLGYDQETGFGLVQVLERVDLPSLPLGKSKDAKLGDRVVLAGAGGRSHSIAARIVAKQEFAGYWEYVLDEAIFTAPAHPNWGGTGLIDAQGRLIGIGSLQLQHGREDDEAPVNINMVVPIDLLKPVLNDLEQLGQRNAPPRPWLGLYATENEDRIVIAGLAKNGPARRADLRTGDTVLAIAGTPVASMAQLYRRLWSLGQAGIAVPLLIERNGDTLELSVISGDRAMFLKRPRLH